MRFSVLMAVYKGESPHYLSLSLQSLLEQTLRADEVVLVEDGPIPDELRAVISGYTQPLKIRLLALPQNRGLAAALNEGMEYASNDLIARMDGDDICFSRRFERQISYFRDNSDLDIVGSYAQEIDENGIEGRLRRMPESHDSIFNNLWACPLIHPTVVFRRDKLLTLGGYNPTLRRRQDYELWFRCAHGGLRFANVPEPLLYYRFGQEAHRKQPVSLAWQQGLVGYRGAKLLDMPRWKRLAAFIPFARALLPSRVQHHVYRALQHFDPRKQA